MVAAMWACHLAGCIYAPVNATLPALSKARASPTNLRNHFILQLLAALYI